MKKADTKRRAGVRRRRRPDPERVRAVLDGLVALYPEAECALVHRNAFELLAATILSAQCTDARVNMVTPELFRRWPDPAALAAADREEVEEVVRSTGFFRNKAKSLVGMARGLRDDHDGEVPREMDALLRLPGVARKTANVVLGTAFGIADGVVVDTHVGRIARRLGFTRETGPVQVERDLVAVLPREEWVMFSHRVIHHGRAICTARAPRCDACPLAAHCPGKDDPLKAGRTGAPARKRKPTS